MPSTPRGRDAATLLAVILTIVLAFAWLRSSDGGVPTVPAGLSVETVPAGVAEPAAPREAVAPAKGNEGEGAGGEQPRHVRARREQPRRRGKLRHVDRPAKRSPAGEAGGQDPPATAPAPSAGSGGAPTGGTAPQAPEFGLE